MRIKLHLKPISKSKILPLNYQYEVSSWLYGIIDSINPDYSKFLHNEGYSDGKSRSYKFFTFSHFHIPKKRIERDRLHILGNYLFFQLSFVMDEASTSMVLGVMENARFTIGDHVSSVDFQIERIERMYEPNFTDRMKFRTISPICVSRSTGKQAEYLSPIDEDFSQHFIRNLIQKYRILDPKFPEDVYAYTTVTNEPHSKLITIKAGTSHPIKVRGYLFDFVLKAPPELAWIGYNAGFGEKNSLGFGCVLSRDS